MKDERKTRKQLINELVEMRRRITELKKLETECKRIEEVQDKESNWVRILVVDDDPTAFGFLPGSPLLHQESLEVETHD